MKQITIYDLLPLLKKGVGFAWINVEHGVGFRTNHIKLANILGVTNITGNATNLLA